MNQTKPLKAPLTWETFKSTYLATGAPATIKISSDPEIRLHVGAGGAELGFTSPRPGRAGLPSSPLRQIAITQEGTARRSLLKVETSERSLYRDFFYFALAVADICGTRRVAVEVGLEQAMESWRSLLQAAGRMSEEQEIGLIGELMILERVIKGGGPELFRAWTGPSREPHDFRLEKRELEVKTTRSAKRVHTIHQLAQLEASAGHKLFLISLQLEPSGASPGVTLADQVDLVVSALGSDVAALREFRKTLKERFNYATEDRGLFTDRYRLRTKILAVPVDQTCPRITTPGLRKAVPSALIGRIDDVRYNIDVGGLGFEDGSPAFKKILPY